MSVDSIKDKLATTSPDAPAGPTLADLINRQAPAIARALPKAMDAERFTRIVLTEVRRTPALLTCDPMSVLGASMVAAQLGLEFGPLGLAYLVPYKRQAQFILGYRGMIQLARRSGEITDLVAREVCEADEFEFEYGDNEHIRHRPPLTDRGATIAYYGIAKFAGGGATRLVMAREDVEKRRDRSKAKDSGPWKTDYDAMARKTVIRAMAPFLPLEIEAVRAMTADEAIVTELSPDMLDDIKPPDADEGSPALVTGSEVVAGGDPSAPTSSGTSAPPSDPEPDGPSARKPRSEGRIEKARAAKKTAGKKAEAPPPGDDDAGAAG